MNVEIGAEAALFPEKKYINGIAVAVCTVTALQIISHFSPEPSCIFEYTNQEYTSAEPEFVKV